MGWCNGMSIGGMGLVGILAFLVFVGGLFALGGIAVATVSRSKSAAPRHEASLPATRGGNAMEILKERYARGEITKEEYQSVLDDLTSR